MKERKGFARNGKSARAISKLTCNAELSGHEQLVEPEEGLVIPGFRD